jgi:hypothetical protein
MFRKGYFSLIWCILIVNIPKTYQNYTKINIVYNKLVNI